MGHQLKFTVRTVKVRLIESAAIRLEGRTAGWRTVACDWRTPSAVIQGGSVCCDGGNANSGLPTHPLVA